MGDVRAGGGATGVCQEVEERHLVRPLVTAGLVEGADHLNCPRGGIFSQEGSFVSVFSGTKMASPGLTAGS